MHWLPFERVNNAVDKKEAGHKVILNCLSTFFFLVVFLFAIQIYPVNHPCAMEWMCIVGAESCSMYRLIPETGTNTQKVVCERGQGILCGICCNGQVHTTYLQAFVKYWKNKYGSTEWDYKFTALSQRIYMLFQIVVQEKVVQS